MGMTKIVASLMLSTALLPMVSGKADTTPTPSTKQETVQQPTSATSSTSSVSAASETTSATSATATSAKSLQVSQSSAAASSSQTVTSQTSTSSISATSATSTAPASSVTSSSSETSSVANSSSDQLKSAVATSLSGVTPESATASQAASATSAQTSTANANSATATESNVASAGSVAAPVTSAATSLAPASSATVASTAPTSPVTSAAADQVAAQPLSALGPGYYEVSPYAGDNRVSSQQHFLDEIKAGALSGWQKYQVLPSVTAAQAILESGWGKSQLAQVGNNLFGIKGSYQGQSIYFPTQEWNGHQYITINAAFRKYPNWSASVEDHGAFLVQNSRYRNLLGVTDYRRVATLMQQDGYATAPNYASLLISIIQSNSLHLWDLEAISNQVQGGYVPESGRYTFTKPTSIHMAANTASAVVGTYETGESVYYNAKIENNGQTWLQYLSYSGANHYVMIAEAQPVAPAPSTPAPSTPNNQLPSAGSYTFTENTNIRNGASKSTAIVGSYDKGQTVHYNGTVQADGLTWLRYVAYSGATHYVATSGDVVVAAPKPHIESVSGSYQFTQTTAIKTAADTNAATVGTYNAGERVNYNAKVTVGNQTWLRYQSYSGATHYVQINAGGNVNPNVNQAVITPATGAYRFTKTTAIKTAADRNAATVGTYYAGNTVYYNAKVSVNGQTWLRYQSYSGASHYVEISNGVPTPSAVTPQRGSFRFTTTTNIRTAPTTRSAVVGEYYPGDVVYYDATVRAEGYTWLRYLSRSGAIHYVAVVH
ncbi:SH3 domain-containing protein [Lactiplantibacillus garii]|nr:SH3 domain-containing protein [Lactiplantibacillus garii]